MTGDAQMQYASQLQREFVDLLDAAKQISSDAGREVEAILQQGREQVLDTEDAVRLLTKAITALKTAPDLQGDARAQAALVGDTRALVEQIIAAQDRIRLHATGQRRERRVALQSRNGIAPCPVQPRPCFHGREIPVMSGFVKTTDIELWEENERLDIHLGQFQDTFGRIPSPEERLDIMLGKTRLPGINDGDQFEIQELARSIAINGVRKPPIIDIDGTLLDGNRRVTACRHILSSDDFDTEHKRRVEYIFVWQLTEHATVDERNAVVVSLNFESDCKQPWPEYVKARKVYEEWQAMLVLEPRSPGAKRQAEMKRQLSMRYALGPETSTVNRYIKMVEWADQFEEYHINAKKKDKFEVKHQADKYFQYFDEIGKGLQPGGVAYALSQDDAFRYLVFDLLYDGKFRNWRDIRALKTIYENEEARDALARARNEQDIDLAQDHLENAVAIARASSARERELGANTRIESFVKWLEDLPVKAFRDQIKPENLKKLLKALRLVERQAQTILSEDSDEKVQ